jgi:hypothetical protein
MVGQPVGYDLTKRRFVVDKQDVEWSSFRRHSVATVF